MTQILKRGGWLFLLGCALAGCQTEEVEPPVKPNESFEKMMLGSDQSRQENLQGQDSTQKSTPVQ